MAFRKSVRIYVDLATWRTLQRLSALAGRSVTQLVHEKVGWQELNEQLERLERERADSTG